MFYENHSYFRHEMIANFGLQPKLSVKSQTPFLARFGHYFWPILKVSGRGFPLENPSLFQNGAAHFSQINFEICLNMSTVERCICQHHFIDIQGAVIFQKESASLD